MSNPTPTQTVPGQGIGIAGIIIGLFLPIVGIILGIIALAKRNVVMGLAAIVISAIAWLVWTTAFVG